MLYFIQRKRRRLYNDECLMKFGGGYLMGAIKKRGEGQRLRVFRLVLLDRILGLNDYAVEISTVLR